MPAEGRDAALQRASPKATQANRRKRQDLCWLYVRPSVLERKIQFAACSQMFVFSRVFPGNTPFKLYAVKTLSALALVHFVTSEQECISCHKSIKNNVLVQVKWQFHLPPRISYKHCTYILSLFKLKLKQQRKPYLELQNNPNSCSAQDYE